MTGTPPQPHQAFDGSDLVLDHDGDTAAFTSSAADLVPGDTNDRRDVFVARLK
jgi:hypothetical protein